MRRVKFMLAAILMTISFFVQAQPGGGKVKGTVTDGSAKILESATITLCRVKDSSVAKISVADRSGKFEFEAVPEGRYFVSISATGHQKGFSEIFEIAQPGELIQLKNIDLVPQVKSMDGITLTSRKPLIEQKIDRTIVNVEAAASNVGTSALEVLEKSPGISVDKDGNISLKGKQGVQVYIDGRPSYLSGNDLANYLRGLSSSQLEQIEIMTNPPAKYEAAGNSGIINIKTKKSKQFGYNGSLSSSWNQGHYARFNESLNINYRKNKVNIFSTVGYNKRRNFQRLDIQRKFLEATTKEVKSHYDQASQMHDDGETINGKIGIDYSPTKRTTLGAVVNSFFNPNTFGNGSNVMISDPYNVLLSRTVARSSNDKEWKNFSTNLNFRHVFDTTGTELTADADYLTYRSSNNQELINAYFDALGQPALKADTLLGNLPQDIHIYSAKMDYVQPLKKGAKFEAGFKTSFVNTDNNAVYDSLNYGVLVRDFGRSNHFIYKENVNAVYVNYSRPLSKKISGQFGLRLENTNAKGNQVTTGDQFSRHYTQLFPTAFLQYTATEKHTFGLNYGRRVERPDYADLNPFIMFLDKYTFEQGNPNLQPQFAHNIELSHTYKGFLTTTLNYTRTTDMINDILEQDPDKNETVIRKQNIANQRQYGVAISAGGQLTKWWSGNVYANLFNNKFSGNLNGDYTVISANTGQFNVSNQFKFDKTWSGELSGFYMTGGVEGVFRIKGFGMMNLGVSKQLFKGKGSLRLNIRDVLYSQKIRGTIKYSNIDASFQQRRDSRQLGLGFTWRFSKGKMNGNGPKRKTGGASEEQNRVKTGGDN